MSMTPEGEVTRDAVSWNLVPPTAALKERPR
jgi:hypothetical protein